METKFESRCFVLSNQFCFYMSFSISPKILQFCPASRLFPSPSAWAAMIFWQGIGLVASEKRVPPSFPRIAAPKKWKLLIWNCDTMPTLKSLGEALSSIFPSRPVIRKKRRYRYTPESTNGGSRAPKWWDLEKVDPVKYGHFWYLPVRFLGVFNY